MRGISLLTILAILIGCGLPVAAEEIDEGLVHTISTIPLEVPTPGNAVLGTEGSVGEYQRWLNQCANNVLVYSNAILLLFGQQPMDWTAPYVTPVPAPVPEPAGIAPMDPIPVTTAPLIRVNPKLKTIGTIRGGFGKLGECHDPFRVLGALVYCRSPDDRRNGFAFIDGFKLCRIPHPHNRDHGSEYQGGAGYDRTSRRA
jgi:hypothetical protein